MNTSNEKIEKLQQLIGYVFKSRELISTALSHHGLKKNDRTAAVRFERLEFLGDRVLGLSLADFFYNNFPKDSESDFALRMSTLSGTEFLIEVAKRSKIFECFSIPKDFFVSINKNSSSIADMMEATFGAIFLDSDFRTAQKIILKLWQDDIYKVSFKEKDSKTQLQEFVQAKFKTLPQYRLLKMSGKQHDPIFEVEVTAGDESSVGYGNSKKNAEHDAATKILIALESKYNFKQGEKL